MANGMEIAQPADIGLRGGEKATSLDFHAEAQGCGPWRRSFAISGVEQ
jgi:hypothetical protein